MTWDEWVIRAACRGEDPELWFPTHGGSYARAKKICRGCPVRLECLDFALRHGDSYGVWGGLGEDERRRLRRRSRSANDTSTPSTRTPARDLARSRVDRYAKLGWRTAEIAAAVGVSDRSVRRWRGA